MSDALIKLCVQGLLKRLLPDNGFALRDNGSYRPDSTAWAILALASVEEDTDLLDRARKRLTLSQNEDGRINVAKPFSAAYWPTSLAALAWHGAPAYKTAQELAVDFLLTATGNSFPRPPELGHDTTLKGWPWIEGTHSWIEPTAMVVLALRAVGYHSHERIIEAHRLMMDRQLSQGGWNCGNTFVFGRELRPTLYDTGVVLNVLKGYVSREKVQHSIDYLKMRIQKVRTPLSLGWAIIGLNAWEEHLPDAGDWLIESYYLQKRYGTYDTALLSLILLAHSSLSGQISIFGKENVQTA